MSLSSIWPVIVALLPPAGVGFLFYVVMKAMLEGDRRERLAHSRWEAEQARQDERKAERERRETPGDSPS